MREKSKIGFLKINLFKKKAVKFSAFLLIAGLFFYALFSVGIAYAKDINFGSTSDKILLNGNVGVGTTNPNFKFSVSGVATNGVETVANFSNPITATAALGNGPAISLGRSDGSYSAKIATIYEGNNPSWLQPSLAFYTMRDTYLPGSEVERMRISSTGNVGIGTTNPGARLTASGAANSDLMTLGTASGIFGALAANGLYGLYTGVSNDGHVWMQVGRNDSNAATYPLVFNPGGGNVGVGNTAPAYKLDVTGNGAFRSGDNSYLYFGPNASWGGALYVGATPNKIGSRTAQVVASDGNLHIDSGTYAGNDIYLNYYNTGHNIRAFGPLNMGSNQITNLATPGVGSDAATKGYVDSAVTSGNASTVGGLSVHAGRNNEANKIVRTDVSGYLQTGYINSSNGDESNNSNPTKVWGTNGSDSYLRTYYTSALSVSNSDMVDGWHRDDIRAWGNLTGKPVGLANMPDTGQGASSAWSMAWKNYGNHMIVDMSASTAPNGSGHSNANAEIAWTGTYPTLMGWNGSNTYGVRVDSARISDSTGNADTVDGYHYNNLPYSANWNDGWGPYNADTIGASKSGFTYAAGAPFSGPLVKFDSSGYDLELNATYHSGGTAIAYRTRNGDAGSWNTWYSLISSANIGSQSVNFANSASYANQLNPLSGDNNYKLAYTADGARTNAGEWGRAVMYYVPNGQTYGIRVDRADAANSAGSVTGGSLSGNLVASNYGIGNMGVYDSTRYQAVWSMGTAWTLPADGTSPGNLYGLAWTHSNAGGQAIGGLSHQLLVMENGATKVALGSGIWTSGNVMASGFIYNSDRNLKKNIATITNPLEKILQLRGVTFDWKKDGKSSVGLIAQEVEEIFPELVSSDGVNKGVQYGNLVAPLIEAVKAQQKEIEELKASQKDFDLLKIRINNLEARAKK